MKIPLRVKTRIRYTDFRQVPEPRLSENACLYINKSPIRWISLSNDQVLPQKIPIPSCHIPLLFKDVSCGAERSCRLSRVSRVIVKVSGGPDWIIDQLCGTSASLVLCSE